LRVYFWAEELHFENIQLNSDRRGFLPVLGAFCLFRVFNLFMKNKRAAKNRIFLVKNGAEEREIYCQRKWPKSRDICLI